MSNRWVRVETYIEPIPIIDFRRYRYIVFHPYMGPAEESRYRNCLTIGCGKSFKFTDEDDWTCPDCKAQRAEVKRRQGVEGDLLDANARIKP